MAKAKCVVVHCNRENAPGHRSCAEHSKEWPEYAESHGSESSDWSLYDRWAGGEATHLSDPGPTTSTDIWDCSAAYEGGL